LRHKRKKMKKTSFLLLSLILFIGSSCRKADPYSEQPQYDEFVSLIGFQLSEPYKPNNGLIDISVQNYGKSNSSLGKGYEIQGGFGIENNQFISQPVVAGNISVGPYNVSCMRWNNNTYELQIPGTDSTRAASNYGTNTTFSMSGDDTTNFAPFSTQIYVPKEIWITNLCSNNDTGMTISKSKNLVICWNPDPNNQTVYIRLQYEGDISNQQNPALPSNDIFLPLIPVPDNGQCIIPPATYSSFPVGGQAQVQLTRGNGTYYTTSNNKVIELLGYAQAFRLCKVIN